MNTQALLLWSSVIAALSFGFMVDPQAPSYFWLYVAGISGCIAVLAAVTLMVNGLANTIDWIQE